MQSSSERYMTTLTTATKETIEYSLTPVINVFVFPLKLLFSINFGKKRQPEERMLSH